MARPPFVLPAGVTLRLTDEGLHLAYDGDIDLQEAVEPSLHLVEAGGDLEVRLPRVTGSLFAGGTLRVRGEIAGGHLHARHVVLGRQRIDCLAISASESITIGAAHITADAIIAPVVQLDPKASGRVTVIDSRNERGATKIKGGFSISDYDDMFGNADEFLAARGLARLGPSTPKTVSFVDQETAPTPRSPGRLTSPTVLPPEEVGTVDEIDDVEDDETVVPAPATARPPDPTQPGYSGPSFVYGSSPGPAPAAPTPGELDIPPDYTPPPTYPPPPVREVGPGTASGRSEDEEDEPSLSLSLGQLEPMINEPPPVASSDNELQQRLSDALGRIVACYEGADLPPAVQTLRTLVEQRNYEALRDDITDVWNGLLGFHQQRGIRPHHQVTHAFNVIHGLVST